MGDPSSEWLAVPGLTYRVGGTCFRAIAAFKLKLLVPANPDPAQVETLGTCPSEECKGRDYCNLKCVRQKNKGCFSPAVQLPAGASLEGLEKTNGGYMSKAFAHTEDDCRRDCEGRPWCKDFAHAHEGTASAGKCFLYPGTCAAEQLKCHSDFDYFNCMCTSAEDTTPLPDQTSLPGGTKECGLFTEYENEKAECGVMDTHYVTKTEPSFHCKDAHVEAAKHSPPRLWTEDLCRQECASKGTCGAATFLMPNAVAGASLLETDSSDVRGGRGRGRGSFSYHPFQPFQPYQSPSPPVYHHFTPVFTPRGRGRGRGFFPPPAFVPTTPRPTAHPVTLCPVLLDP